MPVEWLDNDSPENVGRPALDLPTTDTSLDVLPEEYGESIPGRIATGVQDVVRVGSNAMLPGATKISAGVDTVIDRLKGGDTSFSDHERRILAKLDRSKQRLGGVGTAVDIAGSWLSPMNKLLLPTKVPTILKVGKHALGKFTGTGVNAAVGGGIGALGGATTGVVRHVAETPLDEQSWKGTGEAAKSGALWGGGFGAVGSGLSGLAGVERDYNLAKALASSTRDVRAPGKAAGAKTRSEEIDKLLGLASKGEERGYIGKFAQPMQETLDVTKRASSEFGKKGETVRDEIATEAAQKGVQFFGTAKKVIDDILDDVKKQLTRNGARISETEEAALKAQQSFLRSVLMNKGAKGARIADTPTSILDIHNAYRKLHDSLREVRRDRDFGRTVTGQIAFSVERKLKEKFRNEAMKVNVAKAKELENHDLEYHIAQSIEDLAASGRQAELGAMWGGGLASRIGGMSGMMLGRIGGLGGLLLGKALGGKMAQRGVPANTMLWLARTGGAIPGKAARLGGMTNRYTPPESDAFNFDY